MKLYDVEFANYADFPAAKWRWANFSPVEMACRGDGKLMINKHSMDCLQKLRDALGLPLYINSAYRSPDYNTRIGGVPNSKHKKALAFDVNMSNHDPATFEAAARAAGFTGFGFYKDSNFVHIDTARAREWGKRWWSTKDAPAPVKDEPARVPKYERERRASCQGV